MANRAKTERNQKIWEYWQKDWPQQSIANMFRMKRHAVTMVIARERARRKTEKGE